MGAALLSLRLPRRGRAPPTGPAGVGSEEPCMPVGPRLPPVAVGPLWALPLPVVWKVTSTRQHMPGLWGQAVCQRAAWLPAQGLGAEKAVLSPKRGQTEPQRRPSWGNSGGCGRISRRDAAADRPTSRGHDVLPVPLLPPGPSLRTEPAPGGLKSPSPSRCGFSAAHELTQGAGRSHPL